MTEENTQSPTSLKHYSLQSLNNLGISSKDELRTCCNVPRYQIRRVNSSGAILVVILSYLVTSTLYFLLNAGVYEPVPEVWLLPFGITTSIAGWLADVFIGRYKVIHCSVWMMWLLMIAVTVSSVVGQLDERYYYNYSKIVQSVLFSLVSIGLGGFQANIIQFGLDQLHDASTTEITSFIIWYVSTLISAGFIVQFNFSCLSQQKQLFISLFICISLTLAVILLISCNQWLIKEPATQRPFKLIYYVIKFAAVTKHPPRRSAFTYCEDELPSRIDFGKSKYGGPFTTEQVEDVKTFLRLLPLISIIGVGASVFVASNYLQLYLEKQYNRFSTSHLNSELGSRNFLTECYTETSLTNTVYLGVTLLIILNELFLYPLFHRCICCVRIKSLWKFMVGIALQILRLILLMVFDVISRRNYLNNTEYNVTIQCVFFERDGLLSQSFSNRWLVIPQYIQYTSLCITFVGVIEFICSQVPYSMKGVIIGAQYTLILILSIPTLAIVLLFQQDLSIWGKEIISCEFWYALLAIIANLFVFFTLMWLVKRYKMRKRDDLLPNEHYFAERYYSQETS